MGILLIGIYGARAHNALRAPWVPMGSQGLSMPCHPGSLLQVRKTPNLFFYSLDRIDCQPWLTLGVLPILKVFFPPLLLRGCIDFGVGFKDGILWPRLRPVEVLIP